MWPELITGGLSILGDVFSMQGQRDTNNANIEMQRETNAMNVAEAQKNRDFQEQMSNSAHQREVEDLKRAGLSPALSGNAGASTPAGSMANSTAAKIENPNKPFENMGQIVTSALDAKRIAGEIDMQDAKKNLLNAQARSLGGSSALGEAAQDAYDVVRPYIKKAKQWLQNSSKPKKQQPSNSIRGDMNSSWRSLRSDFGLDNSNIP